MFTPGLSTSRFEGPSLIAPLSPHASPRTLLLLSLYWCVNIVLDRSEEHTSELQSHLNLVCRLLLGKKKHTSELQSHLNLVCPLLLDRKNVCAQIPGESSDRTSQPKIDSLRCLPMLSCDVYVCPCS